MDNSPDKLSPERHRHGDDSPSPSSFSRFKKTFFGQKLLALRDDVTKMASKVLGRSTRSPDRLLLLSDDDSDEVTHQTGKEASTNTSETSKRHKTQSPPSLAVVKKRRVCQTGLASGSYDSSLNVSKSLQPAERAWEKALLLPEEDADEVVHHAKSGYRAAEDNAFGNPSVEVPDQHDTQRSHSGADEKTNEIEQQTKSAVTSDSEDSITHELWQEHVPEALAVHASPTPGPQKQKNFTPIVVHSAPVAESWLQPQSAELRVPAFRVDEFLREKMCGQAATPAILSDEAWQKGKPAHVPALATYNCFWEPKPYDAMTPNVTSGKELLQGPPPTPAITTTIDGDVSALLDPSKASSVWRIVSQKPAGWKCVSCKTECEADEECCAACGAAKSADTSFPKAEDSDTRSTSQKSTTDAVKDNDVYEQQEAPPDALDSGNSSPDLAGMWSCDSCFSINEVARTLCANCGLMKSVDLRLKSMAVGYTSEVQIDGVLQNEQLNSDSGAAGLYVTRDWSPPTSTGAAFYDETRLANQAGQQYANDTANSSVFNEKKTSSSFTSFEKENSPKPSFSGEAECSASSTFGPRPAAVDDEISSHGHTTETPASRLEHNKATFTHGRPPKRSADSSETCVEFGAGSGKKKVALSVDGSQ